MGTKNDSLTPNIIRVDGIFCCSEASSEMISKSSAKLVAGVGLEGDRNANQVGTYSVLSEPGRQLTLISADGVESAWSSSSSTHSSFQKAGQRAKSIGQLRRNVVLRGVSAENLLSTIGSVIQFESRSHIDGEELPSQVFVHRNCVPW